MFATFIAQSKFVTAVCVALSVAAFFVVKPWYYGLLAAIGVFIGTTVVRVPFTAVSNIPRRVPVRCGRGQAGVQFLDGPGRREAAVGHCAINQSLNF